MTTDLIECVWILNKFNSDNIDKGNSDAKKIISTNPEWEAVNCLAGFRLYKIIKSAKHTAAINHKSSGLNIQYKCMWGTSLKPI